MSNDLLQKYLECLDEQGDDQQLYEQLRQFAADTGQRDLILIADVARLLLYRREATESARSLRARIEAHLDALEREDRSVTTLIAYFNVLINGRGLTWPAVLRKLGISPNQSPNFRQGAVSLTTALAPKTLARLASILGADAARVLRLARQELEAADSPPVGAVSYRVMPGFLQMKPSSPTPTDDRPEVTVAAYLSALEESLAIEYAGPY